MELLATILGADAVDAALSGLPRLVGTRALSDARDQLAARIREQFLTSGEAFGPGWLPLKKQPQNHPTLVLTGTLMNSFKTISEDENEIIFGSELYYAQFSEFGTIHEPQRQILTPELHEGIPG